VPCSITIRYVRQAEESNHKLTLPLSDEAASKHLSTLCLLRNLTNAVPMQCHIPPTANRR